MRCFPKDAQFRLDAMVDLYRTSPNLDSLCEHCVLGDSVSPRLLKVGNLTDRATEQSGLTQTVYPACRAKRRLKSWGILANISFVRLSLPFSIYFRTPDDVHSTIADQADMEKMDPSALRQYASQVSPSHRHVWLDPIALRYRIAQKILLENTPFESFFFLRRKILLPSAHISLLFDDQRARPSQCHTAQPEQDRHIGPADPSELL